MSELTKKKKFFLINNINNIKNIKYCKLQKINACINYQSKIKDKKYN